MSLETLANLGLGICGLGLLWCMFQLQRYRYTLKLMRELPHMVWLTFDEVLSHGCP